MKNKTLNSNNIKSIAYDTVLYSVHVVCWDGVEYDRDADKQEIDEQRNNGYVKEDGYMGIIFDFR